MSDNDSKSYIEDRLPLKTKLSFAGIAFTSGLFSGLVITVGFTTFYVEKFGLDPNLAAIVWTIFIFWNTINDPLIGFFQERTGSEKRGRRKPYIRYGAPLYAILFIICWFPFGTGWLVVFLHMLILLYLFDTLFTTVGLISYSLPAEMTVSEHARSDLMVYGSIAQALALLLSFVFPFFLNEEPYNLDPNFDLFRIIMIVIGIVGGVILFVSSYFIKENKYAIKEEPLSFKDSFLKTIDNKPFLIFEAGNFIYLTAQFILTNGLFFYLTYVLGLDSFTDKIIPLLIFFIFVFLFLPIHKRIVNKIGLKKAFIFTLSFTGMSFLIGFAGVGWTFPLSIITMVMIGIGFSGYFLTNQMVMADIIDHDELLTGKRRETSYSGMNALITKPAVSIGPMILLLTAGAFGFDPDISLGGYSPAQLTSVQLGVMLSFMLIPAILILIAAGIMYFYPLEGKEWREKKEQLHEVHQQKEKEFIEELKREGKI
ncbi:MAG: MFS transporter [Candidatus Lokiarchaeota archaeon]|nr:MFS transporter [Candidatus Lokiarchaeota archaeon]